MSGSLSSILNAFKHMNCRHTFVSCYHFAGFLAYSLFHSLLLQTAGLYVHFISRPSETFATNIVNHFSTFMPLSSISFLFHSFALSLPLSPSLSLFLSLCLFLSWLVFWFLFSPIVFRSRQSQRCDFFVGIQFPLKNTDSFRNDFQWNATVDLLHKST